MIISIKTLRVIRDEDYDSWIMGLKEAGVPIDGKRLMETGKWRIQDDLPHTKAITEYEIMP